MTFTVGSRFGHYDVIALIGEGVRGQVGLKDLPDASANARLLPEHSNEGLQCRCSGGATLTFRKVGGE